MSKVRKSIVLFFGQNYLSFLLQFFSSIIISRLLTPHEIGIFSVAMVLIGFAHTLRDFGSTTYVIQEKDITPEKIRSAFALTVIAAWTMAAVIGFGSGYAAEFYREPGIRLVMLVLCLNFILIPFGSIPIAYMQRQMDFKHIALINSISNVASTTATIAMAFMGLSYMSLAWGSVVGNIFTIIFVQVWRPKNLPLLPGFAEIRNVFSFGMLSNLMMILIDICKGAPDLIIGRLTNMAVVGYFGRSMGLVSMFEKLVMRSLWGVALPHFAEQSRNRDNIKHNFLNSMSYVTALAGPFFACLGLLAHPIIIVLYGRQWEPSVPLLRLLCLSGLLTSPFLFLGSMMTAIGHMKQNVYFLLVHASIVGLLVALAAPRGLDALGIAFIGISLVDNIIFILQCRNALAVGLPEIVSALRQSAGVTVSAAIPVLAMLFLAGDFFAGKLWMQLLLGLSCSMVGWVYGIFLFKHPLKAEIGSSLSIVRQVFNPLR